MEGKSFFKVRAEVLSRYNLLLSPFRSDGELPEALIEILKGVHQVDGTKYL